MQFLVPRDYSCSMPNLLVAHVSIELCGCLNVTECARSRHGFCLLPDDEFPSGDRLEVGDVFIAVHNDLVLHGCRLWFPVEGPIYNYSAPVDDR